MKIIINNVQKEKTTYEKILQNFASSLTKKLKWVNVTDVRMSIVNFVKIKGIKIPLKWDILLEFYSEERHVIEFKGMTNYGTCDEIVIWNKPDIKIETLILSVEKLVEIIDNINHKKLFKKIKEKKWKNQN